MKKVFALLFALSIGLGIISCSSDDDGPAEPQFTIVGTWKVTQVYINNVEFDVNEYCPYKGTFQFVNPSTYVENGFTQVDTNCVANEPIGGTWAKNGNNYTLSLPAGTTSTVLPATFTPIVNTNNISKFELNLSAGGIPTRLIFTKQ